MFDRGLSTVDADEPDTSEGVRMLTGAGVVVVAGVSDPRLSGPYLRPTSVTGVGFLLVLLTGTWLMVPDFFASLDTCWRPLLL